MSDDKYIAFDVHQVTTVISVLNAAGREVKTAIFPTQAQPLIAFLEGLRGTLHLTLEEGTYAAWLYDLLQGRVAKSLVCDPRHNALLKEGNKTDAGDARKLAELLRAGMLRAVYHGSRSLRGLHELAHAYEALREDTTRVMNRIKAFYRSRGIDCAGRGVYRQGQRAAAEAPAGGSEPAAGPTADDELDQVSSLRRKARSALLAEARKHTVAARLRQIPGMGPLRVALLMAHVQTPHRFRSRRSFWTYVGLGVVYRGSSEYRLVQGRAVRRPQALQPRGLNPTIGPSWKRFSSRRP